jgi:outer membrane protein assembly factor BamB
MHARIALLLGGSLLSLLSAGTIPVPDALEQEANASRNPVNATERNIPGDWSVDPLAPKNIKWRVPIGNAQYGSGPVVAEGKVFVGTNNSTLRDPTVKGHAGVLMCFDEKTGAFLWQIAHPTLDERDIPCRCGTSHGFLASTPVVENRRVYYVSNRCELVCAETTKGKILWSLDMIKTLGVHPGGRTGGFPNGSPLLLGELVVVGTSHGIDLETGHVKNAQAPSLIAVNKTSGKLVWQDASGGNDILDGQWSSPAAAKIDGRWQVIHGFGDGWLRGLDAATGQVLWKFDCNPKGLKFDPGKKDSKNYIVANPVVHDNKVYVAVGMTPDDGDGIGHLWCIDLTKKPTNKELDLSPVDNDFDPKAPRNRDSALVWHFGGKLDPVPAGVPRPFRLGRVSAAVAIHDGIVSVAETDGYLRALDSQTGQLLWETDLRDQVRGSAYYVDGKVFLGTDSGDLFVFEAGRTKNLLRTIDMDEPVRSPPAAAHGVLYISNGHSLFAIQGR